MQVLQGISRCPGVAMAVAVVVDVQGGTSALPDRVLRQGLNAVKMGLAEADQPEVVVACDLLAVGAAVRIPGIRTAGIVAQADDQAALPLSVPCVAGVGDLLRSIGSEDIVIVDGDEGMVYLDPDVRTLIRYQNALEPKSAERVFLESAHIPARTRDGRIVTVAGVVMSIAEAETAIAQGADALVVHFSEFVEGEVKAGRASFEDPEVELFEMLLALAGGKQLWIVLARPDERLLGLARRFGADSSIGFVSEAEEPRVLTEDEVRTAVCSGAEVVTVPADAVALTKNLVRSLPDEEMYELDDTIG